MRMHKAAIGALATALLGALAASGCSRHVSGPQHQIRDVDGMLIDVTVRTGLPQDSTGSAPGAQAGDNTLVVQLHDDRTDAPVANANVAAYASNSLVGDQRPESGRAQGNGEYLAPIRFGVPDTYHVTVSIDRPGERQPTTAQFIITAD